MALSVRVQIFLGAPLRCAANRPETFFEDVAGGVLRCRDQLRRQMKRCASS